jgi:hypothetical protein
MCRGHISSKDQIRYELESLGEELKEKKKGTIKIQILRFKNK